MKATPRGHLVDSPLSGPRPHAGPQIRCLGLDPPVDFNDDRARSDRFHLSGVSGLGSGTSHKKERWDGFCDAYCPNLQPLMDSTMYHAAMIPSQLLGIDITDWIIAAFTAVLAVLNGLLVFFNWRLSRATKTAADAAKEAADAAKKQAHITENALRVDAEPDVCIGKIEALVNDRGTWELTSEISSDRVTIVLAVHFNFQCSGLPNKRIVRRVRGKVSPNQPYPVTVRKARVPESIRTLRIVVTIYYAIPFGIGEMNSRHFEYWIHRGDDNAVSVHSKDPKDRHKTKKLQSG